MTTRRGFQIRLVRQGGTPTPQTSHFGGPLLWPAGERWPICPGKELPFYEGDPPNDYFIPLLQIFERDFPDIPFPDGTDLLQLLWCPRQHWHRSVPAGPLIRCVWRASADVRDPLSEFPQARMPDPGLVPAACNVKGNREPASRFDDPGARLLGDVASMIDPPPELLRCSSCRSRLTPLLTVSGLLTDSGIDQEEQFFPAAPWMAQVQICLRCPGALSKLMYEST